MAQAQQESFAPQNEFGGLMLPVTEKYKVLMQPGFRITAQTPLSALPGIEDDLETRLKYLNVQNAFQLLVIFRRFNNTDGFTKKLMTDYGLDSRQANLCTVALYDYNKKLGIEEAEKAALKQQYESSQESDVSTYVSIVLGTIALAFLGFLAVK